MTVMTSPVNTRNVTGTAVPIYGMKCHMSQKLSNIIKYIKSSGLFGVHIALYYVIW